MNQIIVSADTVRKLGIFAYDPILHRCSHTRRMVIVRIWSRDCDHCESTGIQAIPAGRRYFERVERSQSENAEGPWSVDEITPEEAEHFRPGFRDHILEAFEDGHAWSVAL